MSPDTHSEEGRFAAPHDPTMAYHPGAGAVPSRPASGNGMGVAAVITGAVGLLVTLASYFLFYSIVVGACLATAATIFGFLRCNQAKNEGAPGAGTALTGAILGIAGLLATAGFFVQLFSVVLGDWD